MHLPEKQRIRSAFDRAAVSYDDAAQLQRQVCDALFAQLRERVGPMPEDFPRVMLDAGCGTGYGARLLAGAWPGSGLDSGLILADFSPAMLAAARQALSSRQHADGAKPAKVDAMAADIEALPLAAASVDLWWSSLTVQWCSPEKVLREAWRVLRPGGWLALSTLGEGTYAELRGAFDAVDRHRHTLDFSMAETLLPIARQQGFAELAVFRQTFTLHYPDLRSLLAAVKAIGANTLGDGRRTGMMGRQAWQVLNAAYETWRSAEGLPARYDVLFLHARKP